MLGDPFEEFGIPGFALHVPPDADVSIVEKDVKPFWLR